MCKVLDEVEERGINKGRKEGFKEGRKEGRKNGLKEGRKEGRKEGEQNATILINYLWENGRGEDARKAANDNEFFNKLLAELMPALSTEK